jgi:hypothetical protein
MINDFSIQFIPDYALDLLPEACVNPLRAGAGANGVLQSLRVILHQAWRVMGRSAPYGYALLDNYWVIFNAETD